MIAASMNGPTRSAGKEAQPEFVEISLILAARKLDALLNLATIRGESAGQLLRDLIDEALHESTLVG